MSGWMVPSVAFFFGFVALTIVGICLYSFFKMNEEDIIDVMNDYS